mmetsp:Transcript_37662/g.120817  ORF Transcript_37662/g.120817 Transcript_37662/m.120817 type:complete len:236 (+) Transcript_37662:407-1114(+)
MLREHPRQKEAVPDLPVGDGRHPEPGPGERAGGCAHAVSMARVRMRPRPGQVRPRSARKGLREAGLRLPRFLRVPPRRPRGRCRRALVAGPQEEAPRRRARPAPLRKVPERQAPPQQGPELPLRPRPPHLRFDHRPHRLRRGLPAGLSPATIEPPRRRRRRPRRRLCASTPHAYDPHRGRRRFMCRPAQGVHGQLRPRPGLGVPSPGPLPPGGLRRQQGTQIANHLPPRTAGRVQ